jgi:hypothetical protein
VATSSTLSTPRPSTSYGSGGHSSNPASGAFMELCRGNEHNHRAD